MESHKNKLKIFFLTCDLVIINLIILSLSHLRNDIQLINQLDISFYYLQCNLAWVVIFVVFTKTNLFLKNNFLDQIARFTKPILIYLGIMVMMSVLIWPGQESLTFMIEFIVLFYMGRICFYQVLHAILSFKRKKGMDTNRVLIVGKNDTTTLLRKVIDSNPILGYHFIGYADNKGSEEGVLGKAEQLFQLIRLHKIHTVFVSISLFSKENNYEHYLDICSKSGVRLHLVSKNHRWHQSRQKMESAGGLVLINPQKIPLDDLGHRIFKRLFDIVFSTLVILLVFTWLFPIIAILIKASSKGPIFFVQKRTGINNKTFSVLKFRTMKVNRLADTLQAKSNDRRITPIGNFMRCSNMDEFPQFFNVLLGQMSVVGPRPHMLKHTDQYSVMIENYLTRHFVKPGITGWAQINGYIGETDQLWKMEKRVEYDIEYLENWNFWWDIRIVFNTIFKMNIRPNTVKENETSLLQKEESESYYIHYNPEKAKIF